MRFHAIACDYDGTLAWDGLVDPETIRALEEVRETGRKLLLVTGRQVEDLQRVFPRFELFDRIIAENGGLVYDPATKKIKLLATKPSQKFIQELQHRGVTPLSVGHVIVATWHPMETIVMDTIRDLGLELNIIFNKGAVMVLPSGINKASGVRVALKDLHLSRHNVVGIGDAENDHAFLEFCEYSVAVSNALPMLKEEVDYVTTGDHGVGVQELIRRLIDSDLEGSAGFQPA
jgi:hydroxymethylpyrimidine pyrophosphatase-like HAD family hydrolase